MKPLSYVLAALAAVGLVWLVATGRKQPATAPKAQKAQEAPEGAVKQLAAARVATGVAPASKKSSSLGGGSGGGGKGSSLKKDIEDLFDHQSKQDESMFGKNDPNQDTGTRNAEPMSNIPNYSTEPGVLVPLVEPDESPRESGGELSSAATNPFGQVGQQSQVPGEFTFENQFLSAQNEYMGVLDAVANRWGISPSSIVPGVNSELQYTSAPGDTGVSQGGGLSDWMGGSDFGDDGGGEDGGGDFGGGGEDGGE